VKRLYDHFAVLAEPTPERIAQQLHALRETHPHYFPPPAPQQPSAAEEELKRILDRNPHERLARADRTPVNRRPTPEEEQAHGEALLAFARGRGRRG
jgi:hypothetical protein